MPAFWGYPLPPHDYPFYWVILDPKSKEDKVKVTNLKNLPKFQVFEFWNKHYTWHIFWSCLIRCANMKWIRWVLLKIQSGHDSVHRRTDGQTERRTDGQGETSMPPFNFVEARGIKMDLDDICYDILHNWISQSFPIRVWWGRLLNTINLLTIHAYMRVPTSSKSKLTYLLISIYHMWTRVSF